jgi:hypothetical protein
MLSLIAIYFNIYKLSRINAFNFFIILIVKYFFYRGYVADLNADITRIKNKVYAKNFSSSFSMCPVISVSASFNDFCKTILLRFLSPVGFHCFTISAEFIFFTE